MEELVKVIMEVNTSLTIDMFYDLAELGFRFEIQEGLVTRVFAPGEAS